MLICALPVLDGLGVDGGAVESLNPSRLDAPVALVSRLPLRQAEQPARIILANLPRIAGVAEADEPVRRGGCSSAIVSERS
jgi:hypothetical protein